MGGHRHNYRPTHNADGTITWSCECGDSFTNGNVKNLGDRND